ncbi:hypothetical protein QIS99_26135 [Streptomyces sp. B-S-A8]|uniref:Uncharacterized protein n=1 Tax=Streptomyces solicavernae TaxID=3043614 RepID=A0ABT6RZ88_9ACTN|nr:hypothetical protein [Streptomyces sp. B-S-A8]MDI3389640.1 hypothetical protein [Streptomyces sp. B-S-A8]
MRRGGIKRTPRLHLPVAATQNRTDPTDIKPAELAAQAADAIRGLNHATQAFKGQLAYPGDAYEVVGPLARLAHRLPQSFDQLNELLHKLTETGAVTADYGSAEDQILEARSALASSALIALTLADHLDRAHQALAPLGYSPADDAPGVDHDCDEHERPSYTAHYTGADQ